MNNSEYYMTEEEFNNLKEHKGYFRAIDGTKIPKNGERLTPKYDDNFLFLPQLITYNGETYAKYLAVNKNVIMEAIDYWKSL